MSIRLWAITFVLGFLPMANAAFQVSDTGGALTVTENDVPVLVYRTDPVPAPDGVDPRFTRAAYIHPLYGLRGEILTQDFPADHFHHRGVFWTWPGGKLGDREFNVWELTSAHPFVDKVDITEMGERVELQLHNRWSFDDSPGAAFVREHVTVVIHPATETARAIDFVIRINNVSDQVFSLGGSQATDTKAGVTKGYGGFCIRPDAAYKPFTFTTVNGVEAEDVLESATPWADVSFRIGEQGQYTGMAVFQNPKNPGYPHPGWIFRHYAFLGSSYPHTATLTIQPTESFELRYRLYIHKGDATEGNVGPAFEEYLKNLPE